MRLHVMSYTKEQLHLLQMGYLTPVLKHEVSLDLLSRSSQMNDCKYRIRATNPKCQWGIYYDMFCLCYIHICFSVTQQNS